MFQFVLIKNKNMIKTVNLQKVFRTEEVETWALNNVSIEVKEGEFVAIMGPSGCGKSTLLNILGLLDNPTGGEYYLNGIEVSKYTESQRTSIRKGVIGFVFQSFNLIDELNVYENIELPMCTRTSNCLCFTWVFRLSNVNGKWRKPWNGWQ